MRIGRALAVALLLALAGCKHMPVNGGPPTSVAPVNPQGTVFLASTGYGEFYVHKTRR